jgi:hypothetical protein
MASHVSETHTGFPAAQQDRRHFPYAFPAKAGIVSATFAAFSLGIILLAAAYAHSRAGESGSYLLFWAGLLVILLPAVAVLMLLQLEREIRLVVSLGFGLALYLVKILYEPTIFTFHDEFAHYRNAINLFTSGDLFGYNPLIRTTAYYPGLAVATDAFMRLTGLSAYASGLILVGCARLTLVGAIFILTDKLLGSSRAAGIAVLVYAANPNFLYWDAQYAYESLALPLALLVVVLIARRNESRRPKLAILSSLAATVAVIVTHHVTAWALTALLVVWACAAWFHNRRSGSSTEYVPVLPALVAMVGTTLWVTLIAPITTSYLGPVFSRAAVQGAELITAHQTSRNLFARTGQTVSAPLWQEAAAVGATVVILFALPQALDRMRGARLPLVGKLLAVSSLLWVILLPLRFTVQGQETANRSSEFLYVGISLCLAFLLEIFLDSSRWQRILAVGIVILLFVGGVAVSWTYSGLLAPDYRLENGSTVVTPDDRALASWMLATLGPGNRVATDSITGLALGSLGRQDVLSSAEDGAHVWQIFYPRTVNSEVSAELRRSQVQYVVVQLAMRDAPAETPRFDASEPAADYDAPLPPTSLSKFNNSQLFTEIYSSGSLRVYQVISAALAVSTAAGGHQ